MRCRWAQRCTRDVAFVAGAERGSLGIVDVIAGWGKEERRGSHIACDTSSVKRV